VNPPNLKRSDEVMGSVVRTYVASAHPVGSHAVAGGLGLSPATIRNEFAGLERQGFLTHPHTSAGRVPTEKGYRLYVDRLLKARRLTQEERREIEREYEHGRAEIEALMRQAARILSAMTRLAGVALFHAPGELVLQRFRVVPLTPRRVMVLLVLGDVWVEKETVLLEDPLSGRELSRIRHLLNRRFAGLPLPKIREQLLDELERSRDNRLAILRTVAGLLDGALSFRPEHLFVEGTSRLVEQPEFQDHRILEGVLKAVDDRNDLVRTLGFDRERKGLRVSIGAEMDDPLLRNCSFVQMSCILDGRPAGSLGVLGPTRMPYDRVAGMVEHMSGVISGTLTEGAS